MTHCIYFTSLFLIFSLHFPLLYPPCLLPIPWETIINILLYHPFPPLILLHVLILFFFYIYNFFKAPTDFRVDVLDLRRNENVFITFIFYGKLFSFSETHQERENSMLAYLLFHYTTNILWIEFVSLTNVSP